MRIGVDVRVLMDEKYSGVSEYAANLLLAMLDEAPLDYEFIFFYNSRKDISKRLKFLERKNTKVIGTRYSNKLFNYFLQKIFSFPKIDKLLGEIDIFWSPHFNFSSFSKNKKFPKKVITVHDLSFLRYPEFFNFRQNIWHRLLNVKKILKEADKIISVSDSTRDDLIEILNLSEEKVVRVYSGNNLKRREIKADEIEKVFKDRNLLDIKNKPFILFLGTIEPRKNIANLIEAYNIFRKNIPSQEVKLLLAGRRGWRMKKILRAWKKSDFKDDIIFLDYISQTEKEVFYSQAKIFIYPSFYEGFGFPPLEAMTYGLPSIISYVSSLPEVAGGASVMIDPNKPQDIAMALEELFTNTDLYNHLSEKSLQRAAEFSWTKAAAKYLEIFKELKYEEK